MMSESENGELGIPLCFGPLAPYEYEQLPEEERAERGILDQELCIVDREKYFIRGCLDIPILKSDGVFRWLVWASLSWKSFDRCVETWDSPDRHLEPPFFGWLNTHLPIYGESLNLKVSIQTQGIGERPQVTVEPSDHPLSQEQQHGIEERRTKALAEFAQSTRSDNATSLNL